MDTASQSSVIPARVTMVVIIPIRAASFLLSMNRIEISSIGKIGKRGSGRNRPICRVSGPAAPLGELERIPGVDNIAYSFPHIKNATRDFTRTVR